MKVNPGVSLLNSTGMNDMTEFDRARNEGPRSLQKMVSSRSKELTVVVKHNTRFVVSLNNSKRIVWDIFIVFVSVYMTVSLPLFIAFYPDILNSPGLLASSISVTVIYFIDILVCLRTTYIDSVTFEEISQPTKITKNYVLSVKFVIDLIATVPYEFLPSPALGLIRCLKVYKIFSLSNLISIMKIHHLAKLILRFSILLIFLVLFVHFTACVFFLVLDIDATWVPPENYSVNFFLMDTSSQYWSSLYHSVFFVAGIKNGGTTILELLFFSCFYLMGAVIVAVLLGYMTLLIRNARKNDTIFNETYSTLSTAMKNLRLKSSLRFKVTEFFTANYNLLKHNNEYTKFLSILPPSLVKSLNNKFLSQLIKKNQIFFSQPKILKFALVRLRSAFYQPGVHVVSQFDDPSNLFFIASGICYVEVIDEAKKIHLVGQINEGDFFGEVSLLFNTECTATVITSTYTNLAVMSKRSFHEMMDVFADVNNILISKIAKYQDNWRVFLKNMIRRIPYFTKLDPEVMVKIMYSLKQKRFEASEIVFTEKDPVDCVYLIAEGDVEVFTEVFDYHASGVRRKNANPLKKHANKVTLSLAVLPMGSIIFPRLFLSKGENLVSAKALSHVHVFCLTEPILESLCSTYPSVYETIKRHRDNLIYFDSVRNEKLPKMIPIDIIKNHKYSTGMSQNLWNLYLKFKNTVMRIITIKRRNKIKNIGSTKRIVKKLKAMKYAESIGKYHLVKQIANDEISEDVIKVVGLLDDDELGNDLLTQFALKANETSMACDFLAGRLKSCRKKVRKIKNSYDEIEKLGSDIEKLLIEAIKVSQN